MAALRLYRQALQIDPSHADALYFVGQLHYERGELPAARASIDLLTAADPRGLRTWQQASVLAGRPIPGWLPDLDAALASLDPAMELNPAESRNHYLAGRWLAYRGEFADARASLAAAAGYNPEFHDGDLLEAWIAEASGDRAGALRLRAALVERLCAHDPDECKGAAVAHAVRRGLTAPEGPAPSRTALTRAEAMARLKQQHAVAEIDLDGDSRPDLLAAGPATGALMLFTADDRLEPVPGAVVPGWEPATDPASAPSRATPWTAVGWRARAGRRVVLAGGGSRPLRVYGTGAETSLGRAALWSRELTLPVLASGDLDGDGIDELLVANVPDPAAEDGGGLVGLLLREDDDGLTVWHTLPGPISAALIADLDGDGDADLAVGRYPASQGIREQRLVAAVGEDGRASLEPTEPPTASVWLMMGSRLGDETSIAEEDLPVRTFAVLGAGRLFVAGGDLEPERPAVESVWQVDSAGRRPPDLGGASGSVCLRAFPLPGPEILCQRGGLVPAEPAHLELIRGGS